MNKFYFSLMTIFLTGCASTSWTAKNSVDEFTDKKSCKVVYGSDFGKGFSKGLGGIHYYPFIEKIDGEIIFGVHNDYNIPVGDVQLRIDNNKAITISYTETPVFYSASTAQKVDLSYMKNIDGIDQKAMQSTIDSTMKNVQKISIPFTATSGGKANLIIEQMKKGSELKMRIIGFGTNSTQSTSGKYIIDSQFKLALEQCEI
ncbi:hypothetical protein [Salinivibrio proteolyticus]|uniref:Uncharacterized protein n=1 Tax=Salinivibrio proteolyticus TaxID=334715 RepID=A0ABY7LGK0_9GAMM|nr:hypothetical protein [Salinivibrio proteolyticus]WBA15747.1 hypothetical protein N7E60_05625 [Salinivibrio proteolyticus]